MDKREKKFKPKGMPVKKKQNEDSYMEQYQQVNRESPQKGKKNQKQVNVEIQEQEENMEFQGKTNKQSLALDILREGFIQSYIDFFIITKSGAQDQYNYQMQNGQQEQQYELSENMLEGLRDKLIFAESESRYHVPVKLKAIETYYELAERFFEDIKDYDNAAYFYKRVIQLAKQQQEDQWEGKGQLGCGKCYDKIDKTNEAIQILEKSLAVAERKELSSLTDEISQELIKIYNKRAQEYEKGEKDDITLALQYYEKCLEVAKKSRDQDGQEGNICHKIGLLYFKNGDYESAKKYQQKYLDYSNNNTVDKTSKQMHAYAALAKCYIKLNDTDAALEHLTKYHNLASTQRNAKSDAALHLATLYAQKGDIEKSNNYYKEHFKEAKDEKSEYKDRKLVDRARVTVGIALANTTIDKHIELVKNSDKNLKALIDWKCKKSDAK